MHDQEYSSIDHHFGLVLCCGITLAQEPEQNIDPKSHPNLAAAQHHVVEAAHKIGEAQKDNRYNMKGHAEKARMHLVEANKELKLAAEAASAASADMQKKKK